MKKSSGVRLSLALGLASVLLGLGFFYSSTQRNQIAFGDYNSNQNSGPAAQANPSSNDPLSGSTSMRPIDNSNNSSIRITATQIDGDHVMLKSIQFHTIS